MTPISKDMDIFYNEISMAHPRLFTGIFGELGNTMLDWNGLPFMQGHDFSNKLHGMAIMAFNHGRNKLKRANNNKQHSLTNVSMILKIATNSILQFQNKR